MGKKYYKILISETGRNSLKEEATLFNVVEEVFATLDKVKEFLIERYGKLPCSKSREIYRDIVNASKKVTGSVEVGFAYSYWNKDISHISKSWYYQTDWIEITSVVETPILIRDI